MRDLGGKASRSYDLAHYFNLSEVKYQRLLIQDITLCRPRFLMLSPPCRYVCQLMHSNWNRMNPQLKMLNLVEACNHIDMSMWWADIQIQHDDEFGFEHPHLSLAWGRESATRWQINLFIFRWQILRLWFTNWMLRQTHMLPFLGCYIQNKSKVHQENVPCVSSYYYIESQLYSINYG